MTASGGVLRGDGPVPGKVLGDWLGCLKGGVVANVAVPAPEYVRRAADYGLRPDRRSRRSVVPSDL